MNEPDPAAATPSGSPRLLLEQGRVEEAVAGYRQAAERGDLVAQFEAGRVLLFLSRHAEAGTEAVHWFERAERGGHPRAAYHLALIALGGTLLPRDLTRIAARLWNASQGGVVAAVRSVGLCLGRNAAPEAQRKAVHLLATATKTGDVCSALLLSARLRAGEGVPVNVRQADAIDAQLARAGVAPLPTIPSAGHRSSDAVEPPPDPRLSLTLLLNAPPATRLSSHPNLRHVEGLLTAEECRFVIAMARPQLRRSQVFRRHEGLVAEADARTSSDAVFSPQMEDFHLRLLQLRIARAAGCELVQSEPLVVLRYAPGEEYRPHRDYLPQSAIDANRPEAGQRRTTICVYLSPVEAGGETEFPVAGLQVQPRAGDAIVFENLRPDGQPDPDSLHSSVPVQTGEKWLATLWLRQRPYRRF